MEIRQLSSVPGVVLFQIVAAVTLVLGARVQYPDFRYLWQHLSPDAVADDLLGSLLALHMQPPGFNLILAGIDRFGSQSDTAWLIFGLGLASLTIALAADAVRRLTGSPGWGAAVGIVLALLPSTVLYALWPAYTVLVAALVTTAAWCVVLALANSPTSRAMAVGLVGSALAMAGLFLVRASFTWLVVAAWVAVLLIFAILRSTSRTRLATVAALLGILVVILLVQVRSLTAFGLVTQSSWSGQNLIKAAVSSGAITTADLNAAAGDDPCLGYLAARAPFTPDTPDTSIRGSDGACVDAIDSTSAALNVERWPNGQYNFNNAAELAWAPEWNSLAIRVVLADPLVIPRVIAGTAGSPGSLVILFGRSDTYNQVRGNWEAAGALLGKLWPLSVLWGPLIVIVTVLGGLAILAAPRVRRKTASPYWVLWVSSGVLLAIDLIAEHGENQRFRVEIDPLLAIVAACTVHQLIHWRQVTSTRSDHRSTGEVREGGTATQA